MKIPNLFILGAPKCATTALDQWLSEHPSIYMASNHTAIDIRKEPHYFASDHKNRYVADLKEYQALFAGVSSQHLVVGESSTRYLYSQIAVANILAYNPDAKFIVTLRNPIDMAYSWHGQLVFNHTEPVRNFAKAWNLQDSRKRGHNLPRTSKCVEIKMLYYGDVCKLGEQLQRLYQQVPANKVHLIFFDDLAADTRATYCQMLDFLGVADDGRKTFPKDNTAKQQYIPFISHEVWSESNWVRIINKLSFRKINITLIRRFYDLNNSKQPPPPLANKMRQTLADYFQEDIALLSKITGRDLSHWQ